jgi:hypothetical protein
LDGPSFIGVSGEAIGPHLVDVSHHADGVVGKVADVAALDKEMLAIADVRYGSGYPRRWPENGD